MNGERVRATCVRSRAIDSDGIVEAGVRRHWLQGQRSEDEMGGKEGPDACHTRRGGAALPNRG